MKTMKTQVVRSLENTENGQVTRRYCEKCGIMLSEEFYTWGNAHQFLGVQDCAHYRWVFIGDYFLQPPQDEETRSIIKQSLGKIDTTHGKYFLLPK